MFGDLSHIIRLFAILEKAHQVVKRFDHVHFGWLELGEVIYCGTLFIEVWLIDEVPWGLEPTFFALDIVGESGALSERVIPLMHDQLRVTFGQL